MQLDADLDRWEHVGSGGCGTNWADPWLRQYQKRVIGMTINIKWALSEPPFRKYQWKKIGLDLQRPWADKDVWGTIRNGSNAATRIPQDRGRDDNSWEDDLGSGHTILGEQGPKTTTTRILGRQAPRTGSEHLRTNGRTRILDCIARLYCYIYL